MNIAQVYQVFNPKRAGATGATVSTLLNLFSEEN